MALQYEILPVTHFAQNCTLLWCDETRQAALVDPGGEAQRLLARVAAKGLELSQIWLTHGHLDHVGAAAAVAAASGAAIIGPHRDDQFLLDSLPQQSQMFGFPFTAPLTPSRWLTVEDTLILGNETLTIRHCPGHTPGHLVFYHDASALLIVGDVLFAGSIGRTDFPRGNHADLLNSIRTQLWPLADEVKVLPGHGPATTIGRERRTNPFLMEDPY